MQEFFDEVTAGNLAKVQALLTANPELANARKESGESALLLALYHGRREVAEAILARNPELTIFEAAAVGKRERVAEILDRNRDSLNACSFDGWTPLHLAAFFGHSEVAELLLAGGADMEAVSKNSSANRPLHAAAAANRLEVARLLLDRGAEVNARQEGGYTPLHSAANNGSKALAEMLLAKDADVNAKSADGKTPLVMAEARGHKELVEFFRQRGAR